MSEIANFSFQDVNELILWSEHHTTADRGCLFKKLGCYLADADLQLSDSEKQVMGEILCRIISDVEIEIRTELAEKLAPMDHISHGLMIFLATSDIETAYPILKHSPLLSDPDLLEIINHATNQHLLAIAVRTSVSEAISTALCDSGNNEVTIELLKNPGARISSQLLNFLAARSEVETSLQAPLLKRPQLPPHLAQKMYQWVSSGLKTYVAANFEIDRAVLDAPKITAAKTIKKIAGNKSPSYRLVEKLHFAGELTTGFMLKSLRQGDIDQFEFSFARLSGLDHELTKHLLYNENKDLLATACKILKLDRIVFSTIYELIASFRPTAILSSSPSKAEILECYDALSPTQAAILIRDPDFQSGKKRLPQLSRLH